MNRLFLPLFLVFVCCLMVVGPTFAQAKHSDNSPSVQISEPKKSSGSGSETGSKIRTNNNEQPSSNSSPSTTPPPSGGSMNNPINCPTGQTEGFDGQCHPNPQPNTLNPNTCPDGSPIPPSGICSQTVPQPPPSNPSTETCPDGTIIDPTTQTCPFTPSPSGSGSSGSHSSSHSSGNISTKGNVTQFVEDCFSNDTSGAVNVTVSNASAIIGDCFSLFKTHSVKILDNHEHTLLQQQPTLLAGTPIIISHNTTVTHSAAYNIGYKLGTEDGKIGGAGLPDGAGNCNSGTGINGTKATNDCLSGYFTAWNKFCPTSKYGCSS